MKHNFIGGYTQEKDDRVIGNSGTPVHKAEVQDNRKGLWFSNDELEELMRLQARHDDYLNFLIRMKRGATAAKETEEVSFPATVVELQGDDPELKKLFTDLIKGE